MQLEQQFTKMRRNGNMTCLSYYVLTILHVLHVELPVQPSLHPALVIAINRQPRRCSAAVQSLQRKVTAQLPPPKGNIIQKTNVLFQIINYKMNYKILFYFCPIYPLLNSRLDFVPIEVMRC